MTCEHGLRFPISKQEPSVSAYVDAAFANEPGRKSRYGYAVLLGFVFGVLGVQVHHDGVPVHCGDRVRRGDRGG